MKTAFQKTGLPEQPEASCHMKGTKMANINHFLSHDEEIKATFRTGIRPLRGFCLFTLMLVTLFAVAGPWSLEELERHWESDVSSVRQGLTAYLLLFASFWPLYAFVSLADFSFLFHRYVITDRRILFLAPRCVEEVALTDISSANIYTWPLGGGNLVLSRKNGHTFTLSGIDNPSRARQVMLECSRELA